MRSLIVICLAGVLGAMMGCGGEKDATIGHTKLPQRIYVWQRDWTAPVAQGLMTGKDVLDGCVVLGAEVEWKGGAPTPVRPKVDWVALQRFGKPVSLALRIAPYPGPFDSKGEVIEKLKDLTRGLTSGARDAGVRIEEFQLDFDCAQKKLAGYAVWVRELREVAAPVPLVITALPSWLAEPTFPALAREARRYVLQVHSVASPLGDEKTQICDPAQARRWVTQASNIGLPFEIALPTYRSYVGYEAGGKLLGVVSDSVRPTWPVGTQIREYALDAEGMAGLVREWETVRPAHAVGLLWYRLPVASDENNWRWPTLKSVMAGRAPREAWIARIEGEGAPPNPADLVLCNMGETDEPPDCRVRVSWEGDSTAVAEALPGWEVQMGKRSVVFFRGIKNARRLPPGGECAMGWLRLEPGAPLHVEIVPVR